MVRRADSRKTKGSHAARAAESHAQVKIRALGLLEGKRHSPDWRICQSRYDANHEPDQMQMRLEQSMRLRCAALASKRCGQTYSLQQLRESWCPKARCCIPALCSLKTMSVAAPGVSFGYVDKSLCRRILLANVHIDGLRNSII